jgi:hypothetical protein
VSTPDDIEGDSPVIYCPDCGTQNDPNAKFCKSCGRSLADVSAAPVAGAAPTVPPKGQMIADDGLPVGEDLDGEPGGERVLWTGRPSIPLSWAARITTRYKLTNERLIITRGFIGKNVEELELYRVNDVSMKQSMMARVFGLGDVRLETTDATTPEPQMKDIKNPERVKDLVRQAARAERQRRRVLYRDEV